MFRPENETKHLILSIKKDCEKVCKQTHTEPQETIEFKFTKSKETFSFKPSIILGLDSNWIVGLLSLAVYNSILNITE